MKREAVSLTCETFDLDSMLFEKVLDIKEEKIKLKDPEMNTLFQAYLREVRKLSRIVDTLGG